MRKIEQNMRGGKFTLIFGGKDSQWGWSDSEYFAQRGHAVSVLGNAQILMRYEQPNLTSELDLLSRLVLLWEAGWTQWCLEICYT